jgi:hypothetical protein
MVVDDDVVFNRFSASCSRRLVSGDPPDVVSTGEAIVDRDGT